MVIEATNSDDYYLKNWLETNVAGQARDLVNEWYLRDDFGWVQVVNRLDTVFMKERKSKPELLSEYASMKQQPSETIGVFADRLLSKYAQIYPKCELSECEANVVHDIMHRLHNDDLRHKAESEFRIRNGWDMESMIQWCSEMERMIQYEANKTVHRKIDRVSPNRVASRGNHENGTEGNVQNVAKCRYCGGFRQNPQNNCKNYWHPSNVPQTVQNRDLSTTKHVRSAKIVAAKEMPEIKHKTKPIHENLNLNEPKVAMSVNGFKYKVLCDCGSDVDIVSEQTADKLLRCNKKLKETKCDISVKAVNGSEVDFRGKICSKIKFRDKIVKVTLYVQRNATVKVLIGMRTLSKLGIGLVDLTSGEQITGNSSCQKSKSSKFDFGNAETQVKTQTNRGNTVVFDGNEVNFENVESPNGVIDRRNETNFRGLDVAPSESAVVNVLGLSQ